MIALLFYRLAWLVGAPIWWVFSALHPGLRKHWAQRWGLSLPALPPGALWVHGASLGEGKAAEAILKELRALEPRRVLLRTATSGLGLEKAAGHDLVAALPFDAPWVIRRWLGRVRPGILVLVEGELWPELLLSCQRRGIPVVVAGVRQGAGTARFAAWAPGLFARVTGAVDLWLTKTEAAASSLSDRVEGRVLWAGEARHDLPVEEPPLSFQESPFVAGSTHDGEEAMILSAWQEIQSPPPLLLAPRRAERFEEVAALLEESGLPWARASQLSGEVPPEIRVVLLDSMGMLDRHYRDACAAFVGGTFRTEIGGHSPGEPARFGLPLVCGPYTHSHTELWSDCTPCVAIHPEELSIAIQKALSQPRREMPARGAAERVAQAVEELLPVDVPEEVRNHPLLAPLAACWMALVSYRNLFWSLRGGIHPGGRVVSVGSLGSGGAGKTPVAAWIASYASRRGAHPVIVSRGYGRERRGEPIRTVSLGSAASFLGDELAMLARQGMSVVSSPDRVAGARLALAQGADVVVLDDAFQHRRIGRDLDVVVVDGRWPLAGGPIPVGTRREPLDSLKRADVLWVNHGPVPEVLLGHLPSQAVVVCAELRPRAWLKGGATLPLESLQDRAVYAFAGIARPGRFLEQLVGLGLRVRGWRTFVDHHPYDDEDLASIRAWAGDGLLVTTEKDMARLPEDMQVYALAVECRPTQGVEAFEALFEERVA